MVPVEPIRGGGEVKTYHHDDMDGYCAGFWVRRDVGINPDADGKIHWKTQEINYNQKFPIEEIMPGEQVWILDFSIEPSEMEALLKITPNVTWIDHHKTAIEKYLDFPHEIRGVRKDGEAGCVLTFKYIHWWTAKGEGPIDLNRHVLDDPVPEFTALIGDRDIWAFKYGDRTKHFYLGCQLYDWANLDSSFWDMMINPESVEGLVNEGKASERYRDNFARRYLKSFSFEVKFEGYNCLAMNMGLCSSEYFLDNDEKYDILMPFVFDGTKWTVSLYSTKGIDVSEIAKKYGGGGHKGAAGFVTKKFPF